MEEIYAKKESFVKELGELLHKYGVHGIKNMEYSMREDTYTEKVKVVYDGDGYHMVDVSGDSETGILIDIVRQTRM